MVGCSTIRFDPKLVGVARGEVVAVDLEDGSIRWRKDVPGGVVGAPALTEKLVVFTATDGKVRAWDIETGKIKWTFAGKAPFFAGPCLSADTAYVADLKGVVRALNLADGKPRWALDLASRPGRQGDRQGLWAPRPVRGADLRRHLQPGRGRFQAPLGGRLHRGEMTRCRD